MGSSYCNDVFSLHYSLWNSSVIDNLTRCWCDDPEYFSNLIIKTSVTLLTTTLMICSSFRTKSTFFCVVSEARTALWLLQASLALSYESFAVMNFRQEFPTRCQLSPQTFSGMEGTQARFLPLSTFSLLCAPWKKRSCARKPTMQQIFQNKMVSFLTVGYLAVRCTPGCEVPTDSSGPRRSSCSWSSCCTRMTGCPWGKLQTPLWPPGKGKQTITVQLKVPYHHIYCCVNDIQEKKIKCFIIVLWRGSIQQIHEIFITRLKCLWI